MTDQVVRRKWTPPRGSLPINPETDKVYVLPTRHSAGAQENEPPVYTEIVRYVPKEGKAAGIPVEFSLPEGSRKYLSEYSIDPVTLAIALAFIGPINAWVIWTVDLFRRSKAKNSGLSDEEAAVNPLRVSIAKLDPSSGVVEGIELEGPSAAVMDALQAIKDND